MSLDSVANHTNTLKAASSRIIVPKKMKRTGTGLHITTILFILTFFCLVIQKPVVQREKTISDWYVCKSFMPSIFAVVMLFVIVIPATRFFK